MDNAPIVIKELNQSFGLALAEHLSTAQLEDLLAEKFNNMIGKDFSGLVQFLYRMDISETRIRHLLKENTGEEAGRIIARLVIERQIQKIETRRQFKTGDTLSGEERW
jgi:hypothetical protein